MRSLADGNPLVFPNRLGNPIRDTFLSRLLKGLGIATVPHGFRSSFRDWAAEGYTIRVDMTMKDLFEQLGAPLRNPRTSWGAVSPTGVYLRVWADQVRTINGVKHVQLTHKAGSTRSPGRSERREHVDLLERNHGMPVVCIVCTATNPKTTPRTIAGFDGSTVLCGYGDDVYEDRVGDFWLKAEPEPLATYMERLHGHSRPQPRLVGN